MEIRKYMKFYGPINGIVCIGLGLLLFTFNVLLIELEEVTMRILMFGPIPLILPGTSLLLFPGAKLTRKEVHNKNLSFWSASPNSHKFFWLLFGIIGIVFLIIQLLILFEVIEFSFNNCFFSRYLGIGDCSQ